MHFLLMLTLALAQADQAKDKAAPRPLEDVLADKIKPDGKTPVMVICNILVHNVDAKKKVMGVKFIDVKESPNVNIKIFDKKVHELKPETTIKVVGEMHFGDAPKGVPSIRYKVKEQSGKKYNDHRHWRTDRAIYILNPTYEVVEEKKADEKKAE